MKTPVIRNPVRSTRVPLVYGRESVPRVVSEPRDVFQKLWDSQDFEDELPQKIPRDVAKHSQKIVAISSLFPRLFILLKNDFHVILRKFVHEVLDSELSIINRAFVRYLYVLNVEHEAVNL